ncbi:MAG: hypothetical protein V3U75_12020 [Methylococcaceae bacterium]
MNKIFVSTISFVLLSISISVESKNIAVTMDDSGSMSGIFYTSLFALQSLVAMKGDQDRIQIIRMNGGPFSIDNSKVQNNLNAIHDWSADKGTPFDGVTKALEVLVNDTPRTEDAILLIITDGDFSNGPASETAASNFFDAYRQRFYGKSLRAFFVSIGTQENQHIRHALLRTFNGNKNEGDILIARNQNLLNQLRGVYASILGIHDDNTRPLHFDKNSISFTPPFPIVNMIAVVSGEQNELLPAPTTYPNSAKGSSKSYQFSMRDADGITSIALKGQVSHIKPWPALAAGQEHHITFDREVEPDRVHLLLKTAVSVQWALYDNSDQNLIPDQQGVYSVTRDQQLIVKAWLEASDGSKGKRIVDLGQLPQKVNIDLRTDSGSGVNSQAMQASGDPTQVTGKLAFSGAGRHRVSVAARYPGFIDTRGRDIEIEVKNAQPVQIDLSDQPGSSCPKCKADHIELMYTGDGIYRQMLILHIHARGKARGSVPIEITPDKPLPEGVVIRFPGGGILDKKHNTQAITVDLNSALPKILSLEYNQQYQALQPINVKLVASVQMPWQGAAEMQLELVPNIKQMTMQAAGSTLDPSGKKPFELSLSSLETGEGLYFKLQGLTDAEINTEYLSLEQAPFSRMNFSVHRETNDLLRISPDYWWCDCFTATGEQAFTLHYFDPQTKQRAKIQGSVHVKPTPWLERCWLEALIIGFILLTIAKVVCILRTYRFPNAAFVEISNARKKTLVNERQYLHHTSWFWCGFWPCCKSEISVVEGLRFKARKNGMELLPGEYGSLMNRQGTDLVVNDFKRNKERPLRLFWNDELSDGQKVYKLFKK